MYCADLQFNNINYDLYFIFITLLRLMKRYIFAKYENTRWRK